MLGSCDRIAVDYPKGRSFSFVCNHGSFVLCFLRVVCSCNVFDFCFILRQTFINGRGRTLCFFRNLLCVIRLPFFIRCRLVIFRIMYRLVNDFLVGRPGIYGSTFFHLIRKRDAQYAAKVFRGKIHLVIPGLFRRSRLLGRFSCCSLLLPGLFQNCQVLFDLFARVWFLMSFFLRKLIKFCFCFIRFHDSELLDCPERQPEVRIRHRK